MGVHKSSASAQEASQLRVERDFLEKQSGYLSEQLRQTNKLYENLVAALQCKTGLPLSEGRTRGTPPEHEGRLSECLAR